MRLYNGCPDRELKALLSERQAVMDEATQNGLVITFFPAEEMWKAFRGYQPASEFHSCPRSALEEALS